MNPTLAFIFPGQGSQAVGMMSSLSEEFPRIKTWFERASEHLDYDLWELVERGPAETLNQTVHTQPAMLVADVALWHCWHDAGGASPALLAGHSLGEYAALVCGGALAFDDAVALVGQRGQFMHEAVPEQIGALYAVLGLDFDILETLCLARRGAEVVQCANINAPGQIVISGHRAAVIAVAEEAKAQGAKKIVPLPVSAPVHSDLMQPAAERLAAPLSGVELKTPKIPVVHNVDVSIQNEPHEIRIRLIAQMTGAVRWQQTIEYFAARGITHVVECGPGGVLGPLARRCAKQLQIGSLRSADNFAPLRAMLNGK